jgi:alginate O-acetyltransferase complex protein AlgI
MLNMIVTWLLCGLWHGANATFILWGLYHGLLLAVGRLTDHTRLGHIWRLAPRLVRVTWTFFLVLIGWALFRAPDLTSALIILKKMLIPSEDFFMNWQEIIVTLTLLALAALVHMITHDLAYDVDRRSILANTPWVIRSFMISATVTVIIVLAGQQENFIYFAF